MGKYWYYISSTGCTIKKALKKVNFNDEIFFYVFYEKARYLSAFIVVESSRVFLFRFVVDECVIQYRYFTSNVRSGTIMLKVNLEDAKNAGIFRSSLETGR